MGTYSAIVVDPCRLFREGLVCMLRPTCFDAIAAAADLDEALAQAVQSGGRKIDLLICSLDPECSIGPQLDAIRVARSRDASTKIVMLMPSCSVEDLIAAVLCGADGIILKDISGEKLTAALDLVMHGQHVLPTGVALQIFKGRPAAVLNQPESPCDGAPGSNEQLMIAATEEPSELTTVPSVFMAGDAAGLRERAPRDAARSLDLTDRERQILQCLVEGFANKIIARQLDIAEATVKVHIKSLLRKINVSNRTQAAIWALNQYVATRPKSADICAERETAYRPAARPRTSNGLLPEMIAVYPASPDGPPPILPR